MIIPTTHDACPDAARHTPAPAAYLQHQEWMRQMAAQRSTQTRCPGCLTYAIWLGTRLPIDPATIPSTCIVQPRQRRGKATIR